jgi:hypothetical protein
MNHQQRQVIDEAGMVPPLAVWLQVPLSAATAHATRCKFESAHALDSSGVKKGSLRTRQREKGGKGARTHRAHTKFLFLFL